MAKKEWTPEERQAFGDKMRAAKAAKAQTNTPTPLSTEEPRTAPVDAPISGDQSYDDIVRQMNEMKAYMFDFLQTQKTGTGPQATARGLVGTFEKYILDPEHYPNPTERLAQEPRLARFAFPLNFELEWKVGISQYQTKDGVNTKEPKFEIQLNRVVMDEDTGEATPGRYVISRAIFHEDPEAALVVARDNGVEVDASDEKHFLDEMRYLRIRDWLLECFYTPLITGKKSNKREIVINGKLVEYFEISSENSSGIPFKELNSKV